MNYYLLFSLIGVLIEVLYGLLFPTQAFLEVIYVLISPVVVY